MTTLVVFSSNKDFGVLFLGASKSGKTSILNRWSKDTFFSDCKSTIGVNLFEGSVVFRQRVNSSYVNKYVSLRLYDTSADSRHSVLVSSYFRKVNAFVLVYDVSNKVSFDYLDTLFDSLASYISSKVPVFLCGTKSDEKRVEAISDLLVDNLLNKFNNPTVYRDYKDYMNCFVSSKNKDVGIDNLFSNLGYVTYNLSLENSPYIENDEVDINSVSSLDAYSPILRDNLDNKFYGMFSGVKIFFPWRFFMGCAGLYGCFLLSKKFCKNKVRKKPVKKKVKWYKRIVLFGNGGKRK